LRFKREGRRNGLPLPQLERSAILQNEWRSGKNVRKVWKRREELGGAGEKGEKQKINVLDPDAHTLQTREEKKKA